MLLQEHAYTEHGCPIKHAAPLVSCARSTLSFAVQLVSAASNAACLYSIDCGGTARSMSDGLSQPLNAVLGSKPGGSDNAEGPVSERSGEASKLDSDFCEALQSIETSGYLRSFFTLPEHARSGLSVYRVGDIALPVGEIQARQIMGQAQRPDFATRPWELNPAQFKLDYSVWEGRLKALYRHIAPGLGHGQDWIESVRAEPSAVLLMEARADMRDYM